MKIGRNAVCESACEEKAGVAAFGGDPAAIGSLFQSVV